MGNQSSLCDVLLGLFVNRLAGLDHLDVVVLVCDPARDGLVHLGIDTHEGLCRCIQGCSEGGLVLQVGQSRGALLRSTPPQTSTAAPPLPRTARWKCSFGAAAPWTQPLTR
eukprot:13012854-Alexandrium_andersonii.AAC.1